VAAKAESLPMLKEITATVHSYGTKIFAQLTHYGNQTKSVETLQPTWAPSAIPDMTVREIPKEMTEEEIATLVKAFGQAAQLLRRANFDGFEIKVAHDGILRQFLSPAKNTRKDKYGGSLQNRARIVIDVLKEIRQYIGDKPLGIRLCLDEFIPADEETKQRLRLIRISTYRSGHTMRLVMDEEHSTAVATWSKRATTNLRAGSANYRCRSAGIFG